MPLSTPAAFISATSSDLADCRQVVGSVLVKRGVLPVFQEAFRPDYRALTDYLRNRIAGCDCVICIVGPCFGEGPTGGPTRRSYTQLEYEIARELGKKIFVFMTSTDCSLGTDIDQDPADHRLQEQHRQRLLRDHKSELFDSLRDLELKIWETDIPSLPGPMRYLHPPAPPSFFVGRFEELHQLGQAVRARTPSVIVVGGMGGQGKTTLVYHWLATQEALPFSIGLWLTAYRGGLGFDQFLDECLFHLLGEAFDKRALPDIEARATRLLLELQERPVLLVIDGVERWLVGWSQGRLDPDVPAAAADRLGQSAVLDDFLREASAIHNGSHLILTTRALPAALEDVAYAVVPMHREPDRDLTLKGLDRGAAVEFLRRRGVIGDDAQLAQLTQTFANHPLALRVLASLLIEESGGDAGRAPRLSPMTPKRALHKLFEETRRRLPGGRRTERLLRVASHAIEDPHLRGVSAVMRISPDTRRLRERVRVLANWSLVDWDAAKEVVTLHPLVREFFAGRTGLRARRRIHRHFSAWYASQPLPAIAQTLAHVGSRRLAIEHALLGGRPRRAAALAFAPLVKDSSFVEWMAAWGHQSEGAVILESVAARMRGRSRARVLLAAAAFRRQIGDLETACGELDEAIGCLRRHRNSEALHLAGAFNNRGNVLQELARRREAAADYEAALRLLATEGVGDGASSMLTVNVLINRGNAFRELGWYSAAVRDCSSAVERCRELRPSGRRAEFALLDALTNRANAFADLSRTAEALADLQEAESGLDGLARDGGAELNSKIGQLRIVMAAVYNDDEQWLEAERSAGEAVTLLRNEVEKGRRDLEVPLGHARAERGRALTGCGRYFDAISEFDHAVNVFESALRSGHHNIVPWLADFLVWRACATASIGNSERASDDLRRAVKISLDSISSGQIEMCVSLLHNAGIAAARLRATHTEETLEILELAIGEAERSRAIETEGMKVVAFRSATELPGMAWPSRYREQLSRLVGRLRNLVERTGGGSGQEEGP